MTFHRIWEDINLDGILDITFTDPHQFVFYLSFLPPSILLWWKQIHVFNCLCHIIWSRNEMWFQVSKVGGGIHFFWLFTFFSQCFLRLFILVSSLGINSRVNTSKYIPSDATKNEVIRTGLKPRVYDWISGSENINH